MLTPQSERPIAGALSPASRVDYQKSLRRRPFRQPALMWQCNMNTCAATSTLTFNHKRCNLPATYAGGVGLPAQTLRRFVRRVHQAKHATRYAAFMGARVYAALRAPTQC
ncbi:hypothetical protein C0Z16_29615 [Paraburkholderia rhynchosiae]|uniref:Uncharacterized protein n=1 Tax=Paraburkholderia rhynchosiae TaxID=487049 RepID=A0ABX4V141_9BURK|nr:hypothetical protein C0Z16_29615 [Paraburkholderia rhynchosiae]